MPPCRGILAGLPAKLMMSSQETKKAPSPYAPLVLVVDDDGDARDVARGMLHLIGYRTRVARDALEALRHLKAERPAAILLDLHMPGLDGFALLDRAKREVPDFENLPVFVASGVYRDTARLKGPLLRRKVWAFVRKPFTVTRLQEGLRDFIHIVPPHPPDPEQIALYNQDRAPDEGAVVHLSSPGLPPEAVAKAEQLAAEKTAARSMQSAAQIARNTFPCEFEAAIFCAGTVVAGVVVEAGPSALEFRVENPVAAAGQKVVVRAQVEGDAFFDLRLQGTVLDVREQGAFQHLAVRLEGERHVEVWGRFLAHLWMLTRPGAPAAD
jgi:CheY-like chemotaxis protein